MNLWLVALLVFLLNVPCGYWREGVRKFSVQWFLAVHLPVPAVVALRTYAGISLSLAVLPVLAGAYFGGQFVGGRLRRVLRAQR